jgi:hypothetical protein
VAPTTNVWTIPDVAVSYCGRRTIGFEQPAVEEPKMEDRQPPRMHLELVRLPDVVDARAEAVGAAGWAVSTWDQATVADHDQLDRRLSRCDGLVIGEGDGGVVSHASENTTAVNLRRYPRPSQGSCSGERTTGILLVLISPREEAAAQLNGRGIRNSSSTNLGPTDVVPRQGSSTRE